MILHPGAVHPVQWLGTTLGFGIDISRGALARVSVVLFCLCCLLGVGRVEVICCSRAVQAVQRDGPRGMSREDVACGSLIIVAKVVYGVVPLILVSRVEMVCCGWAVRPVEGYWVGFTAIDRAASLRVMSC